MTSISAIAAPSSPETSVHLDNKKHLELEDAAVMLLPGLQHAQSLLTVAIQVLSHFAPPSPSAPSQAEAAAKIRRLLDDFGHPATRR